MACPASCAYNEIRVPLTGPECDTLASGTGIDGITDVCDYLQSLPVRLFDIQNHLEGLGNYGALPVNEDSKCKPSEAPTASSLVSEIARAINAITCFLCGVGGGSKLHFHDETGDFNQLATTPLNIPADLDINDTVIEDFDDYLVFWTWDGTTWTKNFVHDKADANSAFQTHNQNIPTPTYTTPLTPPANPEAGDTIIEQYLDGIVYWTFDGTNWVKNFTDSKDIHSYHVLQAGNAPSLTPIFPVPITTAQAGDTAIVRWDNGEAKYTYNGASWVLDWFTQDTAIPAIPFITDNGDETYTYDDGDGNTFVIDTNDTVTTLVDNGDGTYTYTNEEGTQTIIDANDIVTEVNNTITGHKIADYTNEDGTVVDINETITSITDNSDGTFTYTDENGDIFDIDTNRTDHHNILQTGDAPSATPPFPTAITGAIAGDTAIVKWDNGEAKYTFDGTNWVLDWFEENASNAPVAIEDANGNITVLNGNGNIPTDCTLRVSGGVLSQPLNETVSQSLTVGNFVIAPTPANGDVIVPTQTISITNPSNCRSMSWIFVCPGVDMSISGPDTKGGYLGIQSQLSINGGAFTQTTDTTAVTNNSSPVGYSGHDSNTNGHTAVGVLAPGGTVTVGIRVQFIKGIATGTYTSLVIQGFNMAILGSVI